VALLEQRDYDLPGVGPVAPVLARCGGSAEAGTGLAGGRQVWRTMPSGWPADLGLQGGRPWRIGPCSDRARRSRCRYSSPTARDTGRPGRFCRWRPLAAAPASPAVQPGGLQSPLAGRPVVLGILKSEAAQRPPTRPGRLHLPLGVAAPSASRLLRWLAGRAHLPATSVPPRSNRRGASNSRRRRGARRPPGEKSGLARQRREARCEPTTWTAVTSRRSTWSGPRPGQPRRRSPHALPAPQGCWATSTAPAG
jgi:hypothetical protein